MAERKRQHKLTDLLEELSEALDQACRSAVDQQERNRAFTDAVSALYSARQAAAQEFLQDARCVSEQLTETAVQANTAQGRVDGAFEALDQVKKKSLIQVSEKGTALAQAFSALNGKFREYLDQFDSALDRIEVHADERGDALFQQLSALDHARKAFINETERFEDGLGQLESDFRQQDMLTQDERKMKEEKHAQHASTLGFRALQQGDLVKAQARFRTAWQLHPVPSTFYNLVLVLALSGQGSVARQLLDEQVPGGASPAQITLLRACVALKAGDCSEALEEAEAALESAPGAKSLRHLAACAAWFLGLEARALEHLSKLGHPVVTALASEGKAWPTQLAESPALPGTQTAAERRASDTRATDAE